MANTVQDPKLLKLNELAKIAYSHRKAIQDHTEAEVNSLKELVSYAIRENISRDDVKDSLMNAGYKSQTAAVYASQVISIQQDPEALEKFEKTGSFNRARKKASQNRKENNPELIPLILKGAYRNAARLARKYELTLDDHIKWSTEAYANAKAK